MSTLPMLSVVQVWQLAKGPAGGVLTLAEITVRVIKAAQEGCTTVRIGLLPVDPATDLVADLILLGFVAEVTKGFLIINWSEVPEWVQGKPGVYESAVSLLLDEGTPGAPQLGRTVLGRLATKGSYSFGCQVMSTKVLMILDPSLTAAQRYALADLAETWLHFAARVHCDRYTNQYSLEVSW